MAEQTPAPEIPPIVPDALRLGAFQEVRAAWVAGSLVSDPKHPPLQAALERLARAARASDVEPASLLRTLDAVCRPQVGGDAALDWDHVRQWAGGVVIRAYYRAD